MMSVVIKHRGKILVLAKGADCQILSLLKKDKEISEKNAENDILKKAEKFA